MEELLQVARQKTTKAAGGKGKKKPFIEPPPHDMVLRYPIEVWVSGGE